MKFFVLGTATLLAGATSARSIFSLSPEVSTYDDKLKIPGANPLQHCADPAGDILELKNVDLTPNPPKAGENLTIVATGQLNKDVEKGANVNIQVKYGLITLLKFNKDLCELVGEVDLECPLKKDSEVKITKEVELPSQIPPGKYTVVADVITKDNEKVTCLSAAVTFGRSAGAEFEWKENL